MTNPYTSGWPMSGRALAPGADALKRREEAKNPPPKPGRKPSQPPGEKEEDPKPGTDKDPCRDLWWDAWEAQRRANGPLVAHHAMHDQVEKLEARVKEWAAKEPGLVSATINLFPLGRASRLLKAFRAFETAGSIGLQMIHLEWETEMARRKNELAKAKAERAALETKMDPGNKSSERAYEAWVRCRTRQGLGE